MKLNFGEKAIPRAQPQRIIPFHLRRKVKEAITQLEKEGIIEAVPENAPSLVVSPFSFVPIWQRIYFDYRPQTFGNYLLQFNV